MLNVVIADDEEKICRLILALGDWENLGMRVAGTAANGYEALEYIEKKSIDILITDIRMPGLSGIELIEKVNKLSPATRIIIVSGYAEFEYAQAAVHYGVTDYLLKPINRNLLNEALKKISTRINGDKDREKELDISRKILDSDKETVRSALISELLVNPESQIPRDVLRERYRIADECDLWQFFCGRLAEKEGPGKDSPGQECYWNKIESVISEQLKSCCREKVLLRQGKYLYGLMGFSGKDSEKIRKALRGCVNQAESLKGILRGGTLSIALGLPVKDSKELGKSLMTARRAVAERLISGHGRLLEWKTEKSTIYEKQLLDRYSRAVTSALEVCSGEGLKLAIEDMKTESVNTPGVCGWELMELVQQAGSMFIMRLNLQEQTEKLEEFYEKCGDCNTSDELFLELNTLTETCMKDLSEQRESDIVRSVRQAKQYLQNHYPEQITLEGVSEYLGLNSAYFSTLFKKETGTGFSKYLVNVRVEAAKELLRESNDTVAEICRRVGYNDVKHFSKIFEQNAGVKPAVYRKLYG